MEDLIVIILTLIVAVVGSLGQIRKRKQQGQPGGGEQQKPQGFWEMLEGDDQQQEMEYFEPAEPQEPAPSPVVEQVSAPVTRQFGMKDKSVIQNKAESIKDGIKDYQFTGSSKRKDTKIKERKKFPLRKAVIYSEILNRKYN